MKPSNKVASKQNHHEHNWVDLAVVLDIKKMFKVMCTAPEIIPIPKWFRPRNDPQPWNDPQIDPEMIPISLHVDPEMIPI